MLCLAWVFAIVCVAKDSMISPNGKVILLQQEKTDGTCSFVVKYRSGRQQLEVLEIPVVGVFTHKGRGAGMRLKSVDAAKHIKENYTMLTGKRRECYNDANEYLLHFLDSQNDEVRLRVRLYNDGMAFRYEFEDLNDDAIKEEKTTFRIKEGTKRWMQEYLVGYEGFYPMTEKGHVNNNRHWSYPALLQADENVWALISESDVNRKQSGSCLKNEVAPTDYTVHLQENKQRISGTWHTPWRVLFVGSLQDIVSSTLITDTSTPCVLQDTDWIRPGGVSWVYWAYNRGSKDFQIVKRYIDMAAELKLPYVLIDWQWDVMGNGGTIDDALRYAKEKNVRTLLWYNSSTAWADESAGPLYKLNTPEAREKEFAWLASLGVAGVKIDFFPGDTEPTMAYYQDLLESAARHKVMVNFHGATIPRGWQRTYPNMMTVEAVYGAEWYNNRPTLTDRAAAHNTTLPFTRNVIGPMDYTPCTFSDSQHPHITTHAHELALPVVFESALQHWADRPESYLAQPTEVQQFITELPTAWDDTRLLGGYPGDNVVMARRCGDVWYVAGLNGTDNARPLTMDWSFLPKGKYQIKMFEDSGNKELPWRISTLQGKTKKFPVSIDCQPRGGFVAVVSSL